MVLECEGRPEGGADRSKKWRIAGVLPIGAIFKKMSMGAAGVCCGSILLWSLVDNRGPARKDGEEAEGFA